MSRGDGSGPHGLGHGRQGYQPSLGGGGLALGCGLARFGEPLPTVAALEERASVLEKQAKVYRDLADKVGKGEKKSG